jgi:hypothetical protein
MNRRVSVVPALVLCALAAVAVAAPPASAVGTTAWTCAKGGGALDFTDEHCGLNVKPGSGEYGHVEIEPGKETKLELTNHKTAAETFALALHGEAGGMPVELTATAFASEAAAMEDHAGPPMFVSGEGKGKFTGVKVVKPTKCEIPKGEIALQATVGETKEMEIEFKPAAAGSFAEIEFANKGAEKCALNAMKFKVAGSVKGIPNGPTIAFTAESTKNLTLGGKAASFEGDLTARMGAKENPIALTTEIP